jgi:hypothetical protein
MEPQARHLHLYASSPHENGHVLDRKTWRLETLMRVAETSEQPRANVKHGLDKLCDYLVVRWRQQGRRQSLR